MNDTREIIRKLYAAADAGDMAGVRSMLAEDITLQQADGHPYPGTWHGIDDVMAAMGEVFARLRLTGITVREIVGDGGERVVGLVDSHGTDARGNSYTMPVAEFFLVADGRVRDIRPFYWDTARLRQIATPS
jgi:uncharacterized protein